MRTFITSKCLVDSELVTSILAKNSNNILNKKTLTKFDLDN